MTQAVAPVLLGGAHRNWRHHDRRNEPQLRVPGRVRARVQAQLWTESRAPCVPFEPSVPMPPRHTPWVYGIETADICILGASWPPPAHERTAALRTCRADTAKAQASSYRFEESWGGQALKPKKPKEFKKNANPKPQNPKETQKAPLKGGRASRAVASALGPTPGSVESRKRPLFRWALGGLGV